jgi:FkbM family methyltransferase
MNVNNLRSTTLETRTAMKMPEAKDLLSMIKVRLRKIPDQYLRSISGVIHVGANTGQERFLYHKCGLDVLWIEPIPEIFGILEMNLRIFQRQRAIQALVTDKDDQEYQFHVASNNGQSSSILELKEHKDIWPDVKFNSTMSLRSTTLSSLLRTENIDPSAYQALIMDTQGSELLVLKGAIPVLGNFRYIKIEVADFESYKGCCQLGDVEPFMKKNGFSEFSRRKFASRAAGGSYYDIIYQNQAHSSGE